MKNNFNEWKDQAFKLLFTPATLLRLTGIIMLTHIIAFAFGIGIFIIIVGLTYGTFWLFPYWQPAHSVIFWISGNKNVSPHLIKPQLPWLKYISLGLRLAFVIYLVYFGLKMIIESGYCAQSLLC